jgi:ankyrin repeat protein
MLIRTLHLFLLAFFSLIVFSCAPSDPLKDYNNDIREAIKAGDLRAVKQVVSLEPNWTKMHMLHIAAEFDQLPIAKFLISKDVPPNDKDESGRFPLDMAAKSGSKKVLLLLLDKGASLEQKDDPEGQTALMAAVRANQKEIVELLITKGANVNVKDRNNFTPLSVAKGLGHEEITEMLKNHGAR